MKRAIYVAAIAVTAVALLTGIGQVFSLKVAHAAAATPHTVFSNQSTYETPGLAAANGTLYIGYAGTDYPSSIYITTSGGSEKSVGQAVESGTGVGMCTFTPPGGQSEAYIVWAGTNDQVNVAYFNGTTTLQKVNQIANAYTYDTPSCASGNTLMWVGWTGEGNDYLNRAYSKNAASGSWTTWTDRGDTASSGFGLTFTEDSPQENLATYGGTDTPHHINYTDFGNTYTDHNNYTNGDVEAAFCGVYNQWLYGTYHGATNNNMYYDTWDLIHGPTRHQLSGQAYTDIGATAWGDYVYFAWGDTSFHVNYTDVYCD